MNNLMTPCFLSRNIIKKAIILFLIILFITAVGCSGAPKYTYEEYKKIKAINRNDGDFSDENNTAKIDNNAEDDLQLYYKYLDEYNFYIEDFKILYDKYSGLMVPIIDDFDNEQENINKKNEYAELLKRYLNEWLEDLNNLDTPDIMIRYHDCILLYLNKEILFYDSFLQSDAELVDEYQHEANEVYENSEEELKDVKLDLRNRAQKLGIEPPF